MESLVINVIVTACMFLITSLYIILPNLDTVVHVLNIAFISCIFILIAGKMLSWASYLFGTSNPETEETKQEDVAMDTEVPAEKEWVVVDHSGKFRSRAI